MRHYRRNCTTHTASCACRLQIRRRAVWERGLRCAGFNDNDGKNKNTFLLGRGVYVKQSVRTCRRTRGGAAKCYTDFVFNRYTSCGRTGIPPTMSARRRRRREKGTKPKADYGVHRVRTMHMGRTTGIQTGVRVRRVVLREIPLKTLGRRRPRSEPIPCENTSSFRGQFNAAPSRGQSLSPAGKAEKRCGRIVLRKLRNE